MISWANALIQIKNSIHVSTNLNTPRSTHRIVDDVSSGLSFWCHVPHGVNNSVTITENKLKQCFNHAVSRYNGVYKKQVYVDLFGQPDHPCEINIIGMIFFVSGFAKVLKVGNGNHYQII